MSETDPAKAALRSCRYWTTARSTSIRSGSSHTAGSPATGSRARGSSPRACPRILPIEAKRSLSSGDGSGIGGSGGALPERRQLGQAPSLRLRRLGALADKRSPRRPLALPAVSQLAGVLAPGRRGVTLGLRQRPRVDVDDVGEPAATIGRAVSVDDRRRAARRSRRRGPGSGWPRRGTCRRRAPAGTRAGRR